MPIYEYRCNGCGEIFENLVFASEIEESYPCPVCGAKDTVRVLCIFTSASSQSGHGMGTKSASCSSPSGGFS